MRKVTSYLVTFLLANIVTIVAFAQNVTINGNVRNSSTKEGSGAVSVIVKGADNGTFTDDKGNFRLTVKKLPVTLLISSVGYEIQEVTVSNTSSPVQVDFKPTNILGQEVVVAANRVPQKILESPVSIERVSAANIRNSPVSSYYDVVTSLKAKAWAKACASSKHSMTTMRSSRRARWLRAAASRALRRAAIC